MAVLAYPLHWLEELILSCYLRRPLLSETGFFAVAIMRVFLIWIHQGTDEKRIVFVTSVVNWIPEGTRSQGIWGYLKP